MNSQVNYLADDSLEIFEDPCTVAMLEVHLSLCILYMFLTIWPNRTWLHIRMH